MNIMKTNIKTICVHRFKEEFNLKKKKLLLPTKEKCFNLLIESRIFDERYFYSFFFEMGGSVKMLLPSSAIMSSKARL